MIEIFKEKTNCPVLINTSFNVRGEPIVNTPIDAFNCFMGTELDTLVIDIEELYHQFSGGIYKNPLAIKRFLNKLDADLAIIFLLYSYIWS